METKELTAGSFRKYLAGLIDVFISSSIRILFLVSLFHFWIRQELVDFSEEFKTKFNSEFVIFAGDIDRIKFLSNHAIVESVLIFFLIIFISGALYYILLDSSKWCGTLGKKIMKIKIVRENNEQLSFARSLCHYFLSLVPWLFVFYILLYYLMHHGTIYQAITGNLFNLIFGLCSLAWIYIGVITKTHLSAADMICKTKMVIDA